MAAAQDARAPDPVITRPGGEGNVSRYEFAPEDQPTLQYKAPPAGADTDLFGNEVDILREALSQILQVNSMLTMGREVAAPDIAERADDFEYHCRKAEAPVEG